MSGRAVPKAHSDARLRSHDTIELDLTRSWMSLFDSGVLLHANPAIYMPALHQPQMPPALPAFPLELTPFPLKEVSH
jgi:hypothetical protein